MRPGDEPVPAGARVRLEFDRAEYVLGENVLMRFVLENVGDDTFQANFGGDYRGATRALRYQVTATKEAGGVVDDPDPTRMNMGGLSAWSKVKPGENVTHTLALLRYCRIVEPGRYVIRATHDFGWAEGGIAHPAGEAVVTFREPTAAEAEQLVNDLERRAAVVTNNSEKWSVDGEYDLLQRPVYLEPLLRRARAGSVTALRGIGSIRTPEATEVLIELTGADDSAVALEAAMTLNGRLPDPEFTGDLPPRGAFRVYRVEERRALAAAAWEDRFAGRVRERARALLKRFDPKEVSAGAFMVQAVGTGEDGYVVLLALDEALRSLAQPRNSPEHGMVELPAPVPELLRAMAVLYRRGFKLPDGLAGEAAILAFLDGLSREPPPRPGRWLEIAKAYAVKGRFPTREAVLRSIPDPVPTECTDLIENLLDDPDPGVCRIACEVAGRSGNPRFIPLLLDALAIERDEWLLRAASDAADQLGARFKTLDVWAGRLTDQKLLGVALDHLQVVIANLPNGWSSWHQPTRLERIDLQTAWRDFLSAHADELRRGERFKLGDPVLIPELFGRARAFKLPNGSYWPAGPDSNT